MLIIISLLMGSFQKATSSSIKMNLKPLTHYSLSFPSPPDLLHVHTLSSRNACRALSPSCLASVFFIYPCFEWNSVQESRRFQSNIIGNTQAFAFCAILFAFQVLYKENTSLLSFDSFSLHFVRVRDPFVQADCTFF